MTYSFNPNEERAIVVPLPHNTGNRLILIKVIITPSSEPQKFLIDHRFVVTARELKSSIRMWEEEKHQISSQPIFPGGIEELWVELHSTGTIYFLKEFKETFKPT